VWSAARECAGRGGGDGGCQGRGGGGRGQLREHDGRGHSQQVGCCVVLCCVVLCIILCCVVLYLLYI
jgi:hypothetical protein